MTNWKPWAHGLAAATIGGAATAASAVLVDGRTFNLSGAGILALVKVSVAAALLSALAYLKQSPLPKQVALIPSNGASRCGTTSSDNSK